MRTDYKDEEEECRSGNNNNNLEIVETAQTNETDYTAKLVHKVRVLFY